MDNLASGILHWRGVHFSDVSYLYTRYNFRRIRHRLCAVLVMDIHGAAPQGRNARSGFGIAPADLCVRPGFRRVVGDVDHHAGRCHGFCIIDIRVLLLLDGAT